jgi:hypothetical protein
MLVIPPLGVRPATAVDAGALFDRHARADGVYRDQLGADDRAVYDARRASYVRCCTGANRPVVKAQHQRTTDAVHAWAEDQRRRGKRLSFTPVPAAVLRAVEPAVATDAGGYARPREQGRARRRAARSTSSSDPGDDGEPPPPCGRCAARHADARGARVAWCGGQIVVRPRWTATRGAAR